MTLLLAASLCGTLLATTGYFRAVRRYRRLRCLMAVENEGGRLFSAVGVSTITGVPLHATYSVMRGLEDDGFLGSTILLRDPDTEERLMVVYGITEAGRAALRGEGRA